MAGTNDVGGGLTVFANVGDRVVARVVETRDNGIFVEYAGRCGIVSVVELSWDETRRCQPASFARAGDDLEVVIMAVGPSSFGASVRELTPRDNPWVHPMLRVGETLSGSVRVVHSFGVFVNLDLGVVVRVEADDSATFAVGDRVEVVLSRVDAERRKLEGRAVAG